MNIALAEMLSEMGVDEDEAPKLLPEAQIARIKETASRIFDGNKFKVGDLVTIRKDAPIKGVGDPHVIIELLSRQELTGTSDGSWTDGTRFDVVVLSVVRDRVIPSRVPHWMLEAYPVSPNPSQHTSQDAA